MDQQARQIPKWTEAQLRGIQTTGRSLLVSAAAGSGKTAMLAARCAYLICDAPDRCDVDELLVVTFTEAAAAEMKGRIQAAIRARVAQNGSERLHRQLAIIERANVSTLHSFCARLLREHFHAVGLDPAFSVMDADEAALLRRESARQVFDDRYELDSTGAFHRFIDAYGEGDDSRLIRRVIDLHEMLASLVDPDAWLAQARKRIVQASQGSLADSEMGRELMKLLSRRIGDIRARCRRAIGLVKDLKNFPKYVQALGEWSNILAFWESTLREDGLDALGEQVMSLDLPRLAPVASSVAGKELAKAAVDSVRDAMTKGVLCDLLRFKSDEWQEGLAAIQPHAEVFLGLVEQFSKQYRLARESARVVDFSDLERLTLAVLMDGSAADHPRPSAIALGYHERFKHVLVDEYQDINELQDAILTLLSRECLCDRSGQFAGNLFCVGDVKQSIYRFRLAEAARFLDRQRQFRDPAVSGEIIDLQNNFRSRAPLLEAINAVFERLMSESAVDISYDQSHRLRPGLAFPPSADGTCFAGAPIEMHILPSKLEGQDASDVDSDELDRSEREAILIAHRIRILMGMDGQAPASVAAKDEAGHFVSRPIRFGDIVVLLRSIRHKSEQFADILRRAGIPVHAQSGTGYFESTEIRDMLALLNILDNQRQDIPLAAVLRSPLANLPAAEDAMARIRLAYPASGDDAVSFNEAVVRYANEKEDSVAGELKTFLTRLHDWRQIAHRRPLAELIQTIYEQTGYLTFCSGLHDGQQRVANLMDFHQRASHFGSFRRQGLSRFMRFLESLREEADLGQPSIAADADNVVRIISIHRSKGLEFPVVFLPDLGKRINLSDCQGAILADRKAGLGIAVVDEERLIRYPSLSSVLVQERLRQQAIAEELRVLYVAMTRAREHLILVGTCDSKLPDEWLSKWNNHVGAFPDDMILGAKCPLDWLGATAAGAGENVLKVIHHSATEVAAWQTAHKKRSQLSPQQSALAEMHPIAPYPPLCPAASEVIERLEFEYPFSACTLLAAAESVSGRIKTSEIAETQSTKLVSPRFLADTACSPVDIGVATHLALMHLDLNASDLEAEIESLVGRKLIASALAKVIDRDAIRWFLSSEVGSLLKANAARLRREVAIHFAAAPDGTKAADPRDRVMVRGRIDVLLPVKEGAILVDYKTDNVSIDHVPVRARDYSDQLRQYCEAIEKATRSPVAAAYLVFLQPRVVWELQGTGAPPLSLLFSKAEAG